jgi:AbrB family looped-hinge helix DNA binding protein
MTEIGDRTVLLDSKGRISIPEEIRDQVGITGGVQLGISSVAGLIILYREDKDIEAFDIFARFGQLLREKGYDTPEKIDRLVKEIKHETTEDWLRRCRSAS